MPLYINLKETVMDCGWRRDGGSYTVMSSNDPSTSASCSDGATKTVCTEVSSGQWDCQDYVGEEHEHEENVQHPVDQVNYNGSQVEKMNYNGSEVFSGKTYTWAWKETTTSDASGYHDFEFPEQGSESSDISYLNSNYPPSSHIGETCNTEDDTNYYGGWGIFEVVEE